MNRTRPPSEFHAVSEKNDFHIHSVWLHSYLYPAIAASYVLGLFEVLSKRPVAIGELGQQTGIIGRAAKTLLNLLEAMGFLKRVDRNRYGFSDQGASFLDPASAMAWNGMFQRELGNPMVLEIVAASRVAADPSRLLLTDKWSGHLDQAEAKSITASMNSESAMTARLQAKAFPFQEGKVLDVGGGSGVFSIALAEQYPKIRAQVVDLAPVIATASGYLNSSPARERLSAATIDMFKDEWPSGFDIVLLSNILHDWTPEEIGIPLSKAFQALPSGGSLVINEMLLEEPKRLEACAFSLVMLLKTKGEQLTYAELEACLRKAGFVEVRLVPSESIFDLVVARKE